MIDSKFRRGYQRYFIEPILRSEWINYFSPSRITFLGLFSGLLIPLFLALHLPFLALIFLALSGFLDTLDGSLARYRGKTSDVGAALDITSDRLVEFAIILGLFLVSPNDRGLVCILMLGSILLCITTFLVVGIFSKNESEKSFFYSPGIIERAEAFVFFGAMIVFRGQFLWIAAAFSFLVFLTAGIRIYEFFLKKSMPNRRKIKSSVE